MLALAVHWLWSGEHWKENDLKKIRNEKRTEQTNTTDQVSVSTTYHACPCECVCELRHSILYKSFFLENHTINIVSSPLKIAENWGNKWRKGQNEQNNPAIFVFKKTKNKLEENLKANWKGKKKKKTKNCTEMHFMDHLHNAIVLHEIKRIVLINELQ